MSRADVAECIRRESRKADDLGQYYLRDWLELLAQYVLIDLIMPDNGTAVIFPTGDLLSIVDMWVKPGVD